MTDYIDLNTIASTKYLPLGRRQLIQMCKEGIFRTAFQPGKGGRGSKWLVSRSEVLQHRINGHPNPEY